MLLLQKKKNQNQNQNPIKKLNTFENDRRFDNITYRFGVYRLTHCAWGIPATVESGVCAVPATIISKSRVKMEVEENEKS